MSTITIKVKTRRSEYGAPFAIKVVDAASDITEESESLGYLFAHIVDAMEDKACGAPNIEMAVKAMLDSSKRESQIIQSLAMCLEFIHKISEDPKADIVGQVAKIIAQASDPTPPTPKRGKP